MCHEEPTPTENSEPLPGIESPRPIANEFEGAYFDLWLSDREEKDDRAIYLGRGRVSAIKEMTARCGPDDLAAYRLLLRMINTEMAKVTEAIERAAQRVRSTSKTKQVTTAAYRYRREISMVIPRLHGVLDDVLKVALEIIDQIENIQAASQPKPAEPAQPGEPTE